MEDKDDNAMTTEEMFRHLAERLPGAFAVPAGVDPDEPREPWYKVRSFKAAGKAVGEVQIYDDIFPWWGYDAVRLSRDLGEFGEVDEIQVRIHSNGGDVFEGFAIYNILRNHPATVTVFVDGLAASIASVVAMAGDEVVMSANAYMMIHNPWGFVVGDSADLRRNADLLDKLKGTIADSYMERWEDSRDDLISAMDEESWYTATEALAAGLADSITGPIEVAAHADLSAYGNVPKAARKLYSGKPGASKASAKFEVDAKGATRQIDERLEALASVASTKQKQEENEMDEETKALLAALSESVSSLTQKVESHEAKVSEALAAAEEARKRAESTTVDSRRKTARTRLDSLVRSGRVQPVMRGALEVLLGDEVDEEKLESFFGELEKSPGVADGALMQEITLADGERRHVPISKMHQSPSGCRVNPEMLAIDQKATEESTTFEEYRRKVYEAHGESPHGVGDALFAEEATA